jgi:ribosome-associated heat shock protein Hsp15
LTRVDQWLWAARFAKTRALANEAAAGGRVKVGGVAVKPSKELHVGDTVDIAFGDVRRTVVVQALAHRRVSAPEAAKLYEETPESIERRDRAEAERRAVQQARPRYDDAGARPTKRDRRRFESGPGARRGRR